MVGRIKMPLGMEVGLCAGDTVLDGDPAHAQGKGHSSSPSTFQPISIAAKRSPISATAELLMKWTCIDIPYICIVYQYCTVYYHNVKLAVCLYLISSYSQSNQNRIVLLFRLNAWHDIQIFVVISPMIWLSLSSPSPSPSPITRPLSSSTSSKKHVLKSDSNTWLDSNTSL